MNLRIFFLFVLFLSACHRSNKKNNLKSLHLNSDSIKQEKYRLARKELIKGYDADSNQNVLMVAYALKYITKHKERDISNKVIKVWNDTATSAALTYGHLFSNDKKHLLVKCKVGNVEEYLNIFVLNKSIFRPVLYFNIGQFNFVGDTTRDVNGDHLKDFLVRWLASSGCCARDDYDVYLYQPGNGRF